MFCDLKTLTVEELVRRLRVAEDHFVSTEDQITDKMGWLMSAEDEWLEKNKHCFHPTQSREGASSNVGQGKGKQPHRSDGGGSKTADGVKLTSEGTHHRKGRCRNCGIYGHWAEDCKRPKKQKKEEKQDEANNVVGGADHNAALFLAVVEDITKSPIEVVHLSEKKVVPVECPKGIWVLDTGASNHMTNCHEALSILNENVRGTVKFGDGSSVEIHGLGSMVVQGRQ
jgi:hypothetical protein